MKCTDTQVLWKRPRWLRCAALVFTGWLLMTADDVPLAVHAADKTNTAPESVTCPAGSPVSLEQNHWAPPRYRETRFAYTRIAFRAKATRADAEPLTIVRYTIDPSLDWVDNISYTRLERAEEGRGVGFPRANYLIDGFSAQYGVPNTEVAAWSDKLWRQMHPTAEVRLGTHAQPEKMAKTIATLKAGKPLRIVMLGDSIINDTSLSPFDALLERRFPGARVEIINSVRGGTGMSYYAMVADKTEELEIAGVARVKSYVLDFKPDLVILGGISNKETPEAWKAFREVIRQVRAGCEADILVQTRLFWYLDPRNPFTHEVPADEKSYRADLLKVAREEGVAYLDMTGPYLQYLKDAGLPHTSVMRDPYHANHRGQAVAARIIDAYFAALAKDAATQPAR